MDHTELASMGGKARAAILTPERRRSIARKAGRANRDRLAKLKAPPKKRK